MRVAGLLAAAVLATAWSVAWPANASAYRLAGEAERLDQEAVAWPMADVPVAFRDATPDGVSALEMEAALVASMETWSTVSCSDLTLRYLGMRSDVAGFEENMIVVEVVSAGWADLGLASDVAATSDVEFRNTDGFWSIRAVRILLNDEHFDWAVDAADPAVRDLQAVLTHELGHAVGLAHPCEAAAAGGAPACGDVSPDTTMYPFYSASQRELSLDDEGGLCHLYGSACGGRTCGAGERCIEGECVAECSGSDCPGGVVSCSLDEDCLASERCVDGLCSGGEASIGDPCVDSVDCASRVCGADGYCSRACGSGGTCPHNFSCEDAECVADGGVFGDACSYGTDCSSGRCLEESGENGMCTRDCNPEGMPCPSGFVCGEVEEAVVCKPEVRAGGCAVVGRSRLGLDLLAFVFLALWMRRREWLRG